MLGGEKVKCAVKLPYLTVWKIYFVKTDISQDILPKQWVEFFIYLFFNQIEVKFVWKTSNALISRCGGVQKCIGKEHVLCGQKNQDTQDSVSGLFFKHSTLIQLLSPINLILLMFNKKLNTVSGMFKSIWYNLFFFFLSPKNSVIARTLYLFLSCFSVAQYGYRAYKCRTVANCK